MQRTARTALSWPNPISFNCDSNSGFTSGGTCTVTLHFNSVCDTSQTGTQRLHKPKMTMRLGARLAPNMMEGRKRAISGCSP